MQSSKINHFVAWFECFKGVVVLLAGSGLLALIHHDVHRLVAVVIEHGHLNPAAKYPRILLDAATQATDSKLWKLAAGAVVYSTLRFVEAFGLYRERAWAEVLAAASGAVYVPFELAEVLDGGSPLSIALLALNIGVVALMVRSLYARRARIAHQIAS